MTAPADVEHRQRRDPGDLFHLFCCCDPNLGLCGADLTDVPVIDGVGDDACPMCFSLGSEPCARCGCTDCEEDA